MRDAVILLFAPHAEQLEEQQVQEARAKAKNGTKHSRVNGTAPSAAQLPETKRRRITGKQKPPSWFLAAGLAFSAVLASKRCVIRPRSEATLRESTLGCFSIYFFHGSRAL